MITYGKNALIFYHTLSSNSSVEFNLQNLSGYQGLKGQDNIFSENQSTFTTTRLHFCNFMDRQTLAWIVAQYYLLTAVNQINTAVIY